MVDDRTEIKSAVRAGPSRDGWRGDPEKGVAGAVPAGDVSAPASCAANDSNPDDTVKVGGEAVSNRGEDAISCTISDGNGGTVTVPIEVAAGGVADTRRFAARPGHTARKLGAGKLAKAAMGPIGKGGSETLKVQFNGLPSGSVVSHPAAIAKKNAELTMLSDRIAVLQTELAETERMRAERTCDRQRLIDAGRPQEDIDRLSAELADLENRIALKAAQRSVAEIERDIARLESQQLTQTASAGGTASFHGPGSGYVLQLADGDRDDCDPSIVLMVTEPGQRASRMARQFGPKT